MPKSFFRKASKRIFIFINLFTAVLFLMGCCSTWFFSDSTWPAGFLPLAAFYLMALLFLFFIFWLLVKPRWSLIFIITMLLSFKQVQHIIPFRLSQDAFNMKKDSSSMRLMSWNVAQFDVLYNKKNPDIRNSMMELINQYQPDIACFQEMVAGDTLFNLNTEYYRTYSFFPVYEFAEKLNFKDYHFSYNFKDDFLSHQHFGLIIFSKFPIINKHTLRFYPYDYNSNFQYADIVKGKDTFRVFNIHLQSLKFTEGNLEYINNPSIESKDDIEKSKKLLGKFRISFTKRKLQADHIRNEMDKSPYPVIICGDFNDVPNSYAYQTIGKSLQNAFVEKGAGIGRTFSGISPTLRIDNIFVDKKYTVDQFVLLHKKLSDHFPIIADINKKTE